MFRYMFHGFFTATEFNRLDRQRRQDSRNERNGRSVVDSNIAYLNEEIEKTKCILSVITEVCIRKGVCSEEELAEGIAALQSNEFESPEEFLAKLEASDDKPM